MVNIKETEKGNNNCNHRMKVCRIGMMGIGNRRKDKIDKIR